MSRAAVSSLLKDTLAEWKREVRPIFAGSGVIGASLTEEHVQNFVNKQIVID